ncbi:hypothetical protein FACS1894166_02760 [Bacilli bacterium]|nr:hypothetical protein FACS1894166_02760 [Bacilli bacterium]
MNAIQLILSIAGDADTLACIVGSMAEAFYGTDSIPRELIEYVNEEIPFDMLKVIKLFYKTVNKNNIKR